MNILSNIKPKNTPKNEGFFSVHGNHMIWETWGIAHISALVIILIISLLIMIFKVRIKKIFKDKIFLLRIVGVIIIIFFVLNRILLITQGYPFKWEWFPYHLCRLSIFLYGFFLIIGKMDWIKYIAFWSILGSIFGLTLINIGPIQDQQTLKWFDRSIGIDNYFWWDYFLAHGFGFIAPILLWTIRGWKMSYKELFISFIGLFLLALIAFFIDWIFNDWSVNYFFLGKSSSLKLPLPDKLNFLSSWAWRLLTYSIVGIICAHFCWIIWLIQRKWFCVKTKN